MRMGNQRLWQTNCYDKNTCFSVSTETGKSVLEILCRI